MPGALPLDEKAAVDFSRSVLISFLPSSLQDETMDSFTEVIYEVLAKTFSLMSNAVEHLQRFPRLDPEGKEFGCRCLITFRTRVHKHRVIAQKSKLEAPTTAEAISELPKCFFEPEEVPDLEMADECEDDEEVESVIESGAEQETAVSSGVSGVAAPVIESDVPREGVKAGGASSEQAKGGNISEGAKSDTANGEIGESVNADSLTLVEAVNGVPKVATENFTSKLKTKSASSADGTDSVDTKTKSDDRQQESGNAATDAVACATKAMKGTETVSSTSTGVEDASTKAVCVDTADGSLALAADVPVGDSECVTENVESAAAVEGEQDEADDYEYVEQIDDGATPNETDDDVMILDEEEINGNELRVLLEEETYEEAEESALEEVDEVGNVSTEEAAKESDVDRQDAAPTADTSEELDVKKADETAKAAVEKSGQEETAKPAVEKNEQVEAAKPEAVKTDVGGKKNGDAVAAKPNGGPPSDCSLNLHSEHYSTLPFSWPGAPEFQWQSLALSANRGRLVIENAEQSDMLNVWLYTVILRAQHVQCSFTPSPDRETRTATGRIELQLSSDMAICSTLINQLVHVRTPGGRRLKIFIPQTKMTKKYKEDLENRLGRFREPNELMAQLLLKPLAAEVTENEIRETTFKDFHIEKVEFKEDLLKQRCAVVTFSSAEQAIMAHSSRGFVQFSGSKRWTRVLYPCAWIPHWGSEDCSLLTRSEFNANRNAEKTKASAGNAKTTSSTAEKTNVQRADTSVAAGSESRNVENGKQKEAPLAEKAKQKEAVVAAKAKAESSNAQTSSAGASSKPAAQKRPANEVSSNGDSSATKKPRGGASERRGSKSSVRAFTRWSDGETPSPGGEGEKPVAGGSSAAPKSTTRGSRVPRRGPLIGGKPGQSRSGSAGNLSTVRGGRLRSDLSLRARGLAAVRPRTRSGPHHIANAGALRRSAMTGYGASDYGGVLDEYARSPRMLLLDLDTGSYPISQPVTPRSRSLDSEAMLEGRLIQQQVMQNLNAQLRVNESPASSYESASSSAAFLHSLALLSPSLAQSSPSESDWSSVPRWSESGSWDDSRSWSRDTPWR